MHPILPSPPAGLGTSAATHLGPAYLGWGRGDAAAGGLGAVSVSVSPARGGSGRHNHRLGCEGRREGLSRPGPGALRGPRGLLLVRGSSRTVLSSLDLGFLCTGIGGSRNPLI